MPSFVTLIGLLTCHIHSIHHIYHIEFISPPPRSLSSSVELYYYISRGYTWDVYSWCLAYAELACFRFTVLVAIMGKSRGLSCHTFSIAIGAWRCSSVTQAVCPYPSYSLALGLTLKPVALNLFAWNVYLLLTIIVWNRNVLNFKRWTIFPWLCWRYCKCRIPS